MEEIEDVDNSPAINPLPYHPLGPLLGDALPQASWDQPVEGEFEAETLGTGQTDDKSESSSGSSSEESSREDEGEEDRGSDGDGPWRDISWMSRQAPTLQATRECLVDINQMLKLPRPSGKGHRECKLPLDL